MDFLKELFGEEALTYEQFSNQMNERGLKLADLSTGNYVGKKKYEDEISAKAKAIEDLQTQIKTRDKDIKGLQEQLAGNADDATKIADLTEQLGKLQGDYDTAKKTYEKQLSKQSYEFAVREFANNQEFTSNAARRDFINEMISENLKMKNDTIIGADDFMAEYAKTNADAFVVKNEDTSNTEQDAEPKPNFVQPTTPQTTSGDNPFETAFSFNGVRAKK